MRAVFALVAMLGCRTDFQLAPPLPRGAAPLADAGTGTTVRVASPITLDGSGSVDQDGTIVSYRWTIVSAPSTSVATVTDPNVAVTSFTPDEAGEFTFELEVTDDDGQQAHSRVQYQVILLPLTVDAGTDLGVEWRDSVQLAGSILNAEDVDPPVVTWTFVSKPTRSTAILQDASTLTPSFVADAEGTYTLQMTGTTSEHTNTDMVSVVATAQRVEFQGAFIDAVYDSDEDRLVAISDSPPRIRFIDPTTGTETTISLPSTPTAISMDQYSNYVAVATSGQVHIVDLFSQTLTGSFDVPFAISDLVFGPYQIVHCFTPQAGPIQTLDLMTGAVTPSNLTVSASYVAKLHLNSNQMYGLDTTISPADLTHYYANYAPVEKARDSPYSGEYAMGDNLWIAFSSIFVRAGNVFQISNLAAEDMVYRGHLEGEEPATLEYAYSHNPRLITLHSITGGSSPNYQLRLYDYASLALIEAAPLPDIVINGMHEASTGRLLAYSPSYPNKVVVVASAGSSNAFFVTTP